MRLRQRTNPRFKALVDYIYTIITNPNIEVTDRVQAPVLTSAYAKPLPHVRVSTISGLLELIVDQPEGTDDIPRLAESLKLAVDDLLPIVDAAVLLGFATVCDGGRLGTVCRIV